MNIVDETEMFFYFINVGRTFILQQNNTMIISSLSWGKVFIGLIDTAIALVIGIL